MDTARAQQHITAFALSDPSQIAQDNAPQIIRDARYGTHEELAEAIDTLGESAAVRLYQTEIGLSRAGYRHPGSA